MKRPVATEQAPPPAQPPNEARRPRDGIVETPRVGDIRSTTPYFPLQGAARRVASVAALVGLDLAGLVLGVYAALTLRALVYGNDVNQWGLRWKVETDWLPFLTVITVLVFWQAGLYAERERRAGFGRILASLALVGVITLIVRDRHGAPLQVLRARADGGRSRRDVHRPAARELRHRHR